MIKLKLIFTYCLCVFLIACGGGGSDGTTTTNNTGASLKVNVTGTWDYLLSTQGSICDGLFAQGTYRIDSLSGDSTKIGNITLQGQGYDIDQFGNCFITVVTEVSTDWSGRPVEQTADDFVAYIRQDNLGDNTIQSVFINSFNDSKYVEVTTYTNGVVITFTATR